ncbi:MAG: ABC transporter permease [Bacteroidota bacterium]|nr:ABC transporter permease [Bacteroidota bacterium]
MISLFRLVKETIFFAVISLTINKLRTFLSLLGISIGIFAIIFVFSIVDSLEKNIRNSVSQLGDNVVYIQKWPWGGGGEYAWWKYLNRPVPLSKEGYFVKNRSQLAENVAFGTSLSGAIAKRNGVDAGGVEVLGITYEYNQIWDFELESGRYFTENEMNGGKPYCLIGANLRDGLFTFGENPIGQHISIRGQKLAVIGVFEKVGESIVGQSYDNMVLVPYKFVRTVVNTDRNDKNLIMVSAKEGISLVQLKDELTGIMRSVRRLRPGADDNFTLNDPSLISNQLDGLFTVLGLVGTIIGGFSILVGGFGIANIMFVSVRERTGEIGIQKALGAKNFTVLIQFLTESILLCIIGGIVGLFLVYIASYAAGKTFEFDIFLSIKNIVVGLEMSVAIGLLSGFIPALMASRLAPIEAIRMEV